MTSPLIIAVDGTFASGKGTLSRRLADHYGLGYLDTGKLYRAVGRHVLRAGGDPDRAEDGAAALRRLRADELGDDELAGGEIAKAASKVAVHTRVRDGLLAFQRQFAASAHGGRGAVLDGRDIGTVICPDASVKLYVDADAPVRAHRRWLELTGRGETVSEAQVLADLRERDHRDSTRAVAPLVPADDAHLLDTTDLSIERAFEAAVSICDAVLTTKA